VVLLPERETRGRPFEARPISAFHDALVQLAEDELIDLLPTTRTPSA